MDNRRPAGGGQQEEPRTAGGVEVNRRSRGQLGGSRTVEEKRTAGRVEDSARSRGQRELLKRVVFIIY